MKYVECKTQAEADAAAAAGDVIVWRDGMLLLRGNNCADLYGSSYAYMYDNSQASLYDSSHATLFDSGHAYLHGSSSARAFDSGRVYDGITGTKLRRDRPRIVIGPLGPRDTTLRASFPADGDNPIIHAECWTERLPDFELRVAEVYPSGRYGPEYRAAIAMIHAIAAIPQEGQ